ISLAYSIAFIETDLPRGAGYALVETLRAQVGAWRYIPVIAVASTLSTRDRIKCRAMGFSDIMQAPIELNELQRITRVWLGDDAVPDQSALREQFNSVVLLDICRRLHDAESQHAPGKAARAFRELEAEVGQRQSRMPGPRTPRPSAAETHALRRRRPSILVVEDDKSTLLTIKRVLEKQNYTVVEASDLHDAMKCCERALPDLVLMDAILPDGTGFELCGNIKRIAGATDLPVLFVTSLTDDQSVRRAFAAGAIDYIPKPIHFDTLTRRIHTVLNARHAEARVRELSLRDSITELPNRADFRNRLTSMLDRAQSARHQLAVMFLDLDRFKFVNETLGHDVGDLLLSAVADRLQAAIRSTDLVARLGGDEFGLVLDQIDSPAVAAAVAETIKGSLSSPFNVLEQEIFISASIGIAVYPSDATDSGVLMKKADTAMSRAKINATGSQFYESGMERSSSRRLMLEADLRRALDREEFVLHYQPQIDLVSRRCVGMEALIRWQHPVNGTVPPNDFIPIAEDTGFICDIGAWALQRACQDLMEWRLEGSAPEYVAVNLSSRQLDRPDLISTVNDALRTTGLAATALELEITESAVMKREELVINTLQGLKDIGVRLAIDDFGTGYSSFLYLKRFPLDVLKIDRSFISDLSSDPESTELIKGMLALAHALQLSVVAEGVETVEQLAFLTTQSCDLAQGYLISKPIPIDELKAQFTVMDTAYQNG
ncbi:MAG: EAL domain-containing protein, partial [Gammaproteobacteria bacterium]|nr:EAL domain-containing protein [Gammaproteobacteria bacterium]